jgi:hypothetical protein
VGGRFAAILETAVVPRFIVAFVVCLSAAGSPVPAPKGVFRGNVVKVADYTLELKTTIGTHYTCEFDKHTYMERDGQRVFAGALKADEPVEIITDIRGTACYTRTLRFIPSTARLTTVRPYRSSIDHIYPRGNLTFAGVVRRFNPQILVLRTRDDAEKIVLLREDTRYLDSGIPVDFSRLAVNTRVFIRGGKNFENDLEAYQVIWGEIPGPKRTH